MTESYGAWRGRWWQHNTDAHVVGLAVVAVLATWLGETRPSPPIVAVAAAGAVVCLPRRRDLIVLVTLFALVASLASQRAWQQASPRQLGRYQGWVTVVSDPAPIGPGIRVVLEIEGQRFEAKVFGPLRRRLHGREAGEQVEVIGSRRASTGPWARRAQVRHVIGEFVIEGVGGHDPGDPLARASNRVRDRLRVAGATTMPADQAALFTGLVIGDDVAQPPEMVDQFRAAGLSHLTAVSGQNVAFVLAVAGLGLRRLPRWWRAGATLAVIAWFAVITRVEPSVIRAGMMAAMSAIAFAMGRERAPVRILALSVTLLVFLDPLLVWSVAFWLSVGATFGVTTVAPVLAARLCGPVWIVAPLSVSVGAQLGVLIPSWLVFHRLPTLALVSNLLAVPVAGVVMLYGIPAGLVAASLPFAADVVMLPCVVGTRWVSTVAALAARLEPSGALSTLAWALQIAGGGWWWRRSRGPSVEPPPSVRR